MGDVQKEWDEFFAKLVQSQSRLVLASRVTKSLFSALDVFDSDEMLALRKRIISHELLAGDGALARKIAMEVGLRMMQVGDAIDELAAFDDAHK